MFAILVTLNPNNMKKFIANWREAQCITGNYDQQKLVDIAAEILEEINNLLLHPKKDFKISF